MSDGGSDAANDPFSDGRPADPVWLRIEKTIHSAVVESGWYQPASSLRDLHIQAKIRRPDKRLRQLKGHLGRDTGVPIEQTGQRHSGVFRDVDV